MWGRVVGMGCGDGLWGWVVGMGGDRRHSGGFLLRIMPPPWHSVPALRNNDLPQAGHSTCRHDGTAGGTVLLPSKDCCRRNDSTLLRQLLQAELIYFAATKIRIGHGNVAATTSQEGHSTCRYDGAAGGTVLVRSKDCCRRTVLLAGTIALQRFSISSPDLRIDAAKRSKQGQSVHRFSISSPDLRIDAAKRSKQGQSVH